MPITLVFVHGWSVTSKTTYGDLPEAITAAAQEQGLEVDIQHIYLGRYISFHDEVVMDDVANAMHQALVDLPGNAGGIKEFSCITHSTGGPLVRRWVDLHYGAERLEDCPLKHLVMLAPANHGSALAILGKARVGRIKAWFNGVEPGQGILNWLSLGSTEAWELQRHFANYSLDGKEFYPFVLSGETIDHRFYDFLNSYLVEKGSDGVVRLAAANLNYSFLRLEQTDDTYVTTDTKKEVFQLQLSPTQQPRPPETAFRVIPNASHSGGRIGIMASVKESNRDDKPVVGEIIQCLQVESDDDYRARRDAMGASTNTVQETESWEYYEQGSLQRFVMFIFRVSDEDGRPIHDYDLLLLGPGYSPKTLPSKFFVDRQKNPLSGAVTYYLDHERLKEMELGLRIVARPYYSTAKRSDKPEAFAGYIPVEFRSDGIRLQDYIRPNETVYVDIVLKRAVDKEALRFDPLSAGKGSFKKITPTGRI